MTERGAPSHGVFETRFEIVQLVEDIDVISVGLGSVLVFKVDFARRHVVLKVLLVLR